MTTVYLHVGMPKCASSTIQGYFHRFDKRNAKAGFVYPVAGRSTGGYFNHVPIVKMEPDEVRDVVQAIAAEAEGAETIFISAEEFGNAYWDRPVTGHVIDALNATFGAENVRLLFLFRNHFSFIESAFAQFLKGGLYRVNHGKFFRKTNGDVQAYCKIFRKENGFDFFDYARTIQAFRKFCDPANQIEVMSIEKDDLQTGDILSELCEKFSLVQPSGRKVKNARFPAKALLGLAYGIERHGFNTIRALRKEVATHFGEAEEGYSSLLHIHGDHAEAIAKRQRADAKYFKSEFGKDFSALFAPRAVPPHFDDPQGEIRLTEEDRAWLDAYYSTGT